MTEIDNDEVRTILALYSQNCAKQIKVANDGLVSVLNNEMSQEVKDDSEHQLAQDAYLQTKEAVETLVELSDSLDETNEDEPSVAERFNPTVEE